MRLMQKHEDPSQMPGPCARLQSHCTSQLAQAENGEELILACCRVRCKCEFAHDFKELRCLTDEEAVRGQAIEDSHNGALHRARTNDGDRRKLPVQKDGWFQHDKVSLEFVRLSQRVSRIVEIGKGDKCT